MPDSPFAKALAASLRRQESVFRSTLILNPVENLPFASDIAPASGFLHGLYNTDKVRSAAQRMETVHQFAGRDRIAFDSRRIYDAWARALGASDVSMRLLSGLHAHAVIFMALAEPGQSVLLLPEIAGGHMATKMILQRLGLTVIDMAVDCCGRRVDVAATRELIRVHAPGFLFVDRSEGLNYETFSELLDGYRGVSIFDASQYLTNVLAGDHTSPFAMGFDLVISTLHKNFPGPQKALVATRTRDEVWSRLLSGISTFVSNMHSYGTYAAGASLERRDYIRCYSQRMLANAVALEDHLAAAGVDVVRRAADKAPTHHLWVRAPDRATAFRRFRDLERCRILTNFRKLPYGLGFGLRLGLNAATRMGLEPADTRDLAGLIASIFERGPRSCLRHQSRALIEEVWRRCPG
jgi:glycine hydroxymethyltransferase